MLSLKFCKKVKNMIQNSLNCKNATTVVFFFLCRCAHDVLGVRQLLYPLIYSYGGW